MTDDTKEVVTNIAKMAPHWAALLLLVVAFLIYLDRQQSTADLVAEQRIKTCHEVQARATDVLSELVDEAKAAAVADATLRQTFAGYQAEIKQHHIAHQSVVDEFRRIHADLLEIKRLRDAAK